MSPRAGSETAPTREALEELYLRLEKPLYNAVYRWLWDPAESRDVVHDAFVKLWGMRERVRWQTAEPLAYRIALNLAANRRRARRLRRALGLEALRERPDPEAKPHEDLERRQLDAAVREAIDALPERLRRVVALCDLADLTYQQAGEVLGIPEGTVGSRRNAALKALRARLGDFAPAVPAARKAAE